MRIPEQTISEISEKIDIVSLIGEYVTLSRKGNRFWGLCPFHTEKSPSFSVTPEKNIFYCFGCHKGGSVYNFLMEIEKISFVESVQLAAKRAGVSIEVEKSQTTLQRDAYCELYKRVAGSFHHILQNSASAAEARDYLKKRKITMELQELFLIGYAPKDRNWLYDFLIDKSYSDKFLSESGLFSKGKNAYFSDRIMFPIFNSRQEVIAFGGRALSDYGPKYLNSPETAFYHKGSNLYGLHTALPEIKKTGMFYLVEGYMDVIAMNASGISNCIAPLGTALTESQAQMMRRYAEKAVIFFDSDDAGIKATLRAIDILERLEFHTEVISFSDAKDPAEIFEKEGTDALKNVLKYSINSFQYILKRAKNTFTTSTLEGKEGFFAFIVPYLTTVQSGIRKESYINITAEALETTPDAVKQDLLRFQNNQGKRAGNAEKVPRQQEKVSDELYILLAIALSPVYFKEARKFISTEDIFDDHAKALYIALEECFRNEENTLESLLQRLDNEYVRELLLEKAASDELSINHEQLIHGGIRAIQQKSLEKKRDIIIKKMRMCENRNSDFISIRDLQLEVMYIDAELKKLKVREHDRNN
ncbi:MAG: DNA primase [Spirochaetales bacterium]|nr:DNA primase [Spirochaetales bacterium]